MKSYRQTAKHLFWTLLFTSTVTLASTPRLKIKTQHGSILEERKRDQMERLAKQYDLAKYTLTRNIMIEQGAMNH